MSRWGRPAATYAALAALWELAVWGLSIPVYLLPPLSIILNRLASDWNRLWPHTLVTLKETLLGFGLSAVIGVALGILIVYSRPIAQVLYPLLVSAQTIPKVALAPVVVVWFGFGMLPKILVAFLIAFFPIVIDTVVGMQRIDRELLYLASSLRASPMETFLRFRFPFALPQIFAGLKVGASLAVVGAVVGEFIAAEEGLGYLLLLANSLIDMPLVFATLILLSVMGVALFYALVLLEAIVVPAAYRNVSETVGHAGSM